MEAILKFNLPEEDGEYKLSIRGKDYFSKLWDIDQSLRSWLKHGHTFTTPEQVMEWVRGEIAETEIYDIP